MLTKKQQKENNKAIFAAHLCITLSYNKHKYWTFFDRVYGGGGRRQKAYSINTLISQSFFQQKSQQADS